MEVTYQGRVWKVGNGNVVTVPKELSGKYVRITVEEIPMLPDSRAASALLKKQAVAQLEGKQGANNEPGRIHTLTTDRSMEGTFLAFNRTAGFERFTDSEISPV
jgi:hypothetical protein